MTDRRGRLLVALVTLGALLGIVAVAAATEVTSGPLTVEIRIRHSRYLPSAAAVPVGRPVRFVFRNEDPIDHEWIVGEAEVHEGHRRGTEPHHRGRPSEVSIPASATVTTVVTFPATGRLAYICHLPGHEAYGMVGTLTVR